MAWLVALAALAVEAHAQNGTLRGTIVDSSRVGIPGVTVAIPGLGRTTRTDSTGRMILRALPVGDFSLSIRRLGFQAQTRQVRITTAGDDSITVTLVAQPVSIAEIDVSAIGRSPQFQGFDQRRRQGIGTFITREQIDSLHSATPSDLFRNMSHVQLISTDWGFGVRIPTNVSILRGPQLCTPMIWLDGQRLPGMEIDELRSSDIEAVEVYRGASTTPSQFATMGAAACGAIVIWSRRRY